MCMLTSCSGNPRSGRCGVTCSAGLYLPAAPAPIEESATAQEQDHDEVDEERISVHVRNAGRGRRCLCSVLYVAPSNQVLRVTQAAIRDRRAIDSTRKVQWLRLRRLRLLESDSAAK